MSTAATAPDLTLPLLGGRHHFLLRRLHSLTGILFGGYVIVHLIVNATLVQGGVGADNIYQMQVNKIHALPFLWVIEWTFIYIPIIFHTIYGLYITFTAQPNVVRYPYEKNIFYGFQRLTALVIVVFLIFHVLGMKGAFGHTLQFQDKDAAFSAARHVNSSWIVAYIVYPLGVLCSCYHLANGFWTAGITWGLTVSAGAQRRWGWVCAILFVITLASGTIALAWLLAHPHLAPLGVALNRTA